MNGLAIALVGGLVWIGLRGDASSASFIVGVVVAAAAAWATGLPLRRGRLSPGGVARGAALCARILLNFAVDLTSANFRQLRLVLRPGLRVRPRWVRFQTILERPGSQLLMGVLISLTPGTVTEELRGGQYVVHVLDADPDDDVVGAIRRRLESPLSRLENL